MLRGYSFRIIRTDGTALFCRLVICPQSVYRTQINFFKYARHVCSTASARQIISSFLSVIINSLVSCQNTPRQIKVGITYKDCPATPAAYSSYRRQKHLHIQKNK